MTVPVLSIGDALRGVRRALGLRQEDLAERVLVVRETISAWERGRSAPTHEQREVIVRHLAAAPEEVLMPLVAALGVATPGAVGRGPASAAATARTLAAVRAAADQLDVPASALRRTLAVVLAHLGAAGVTLDAAAAALATTKR